MYSYNAKVFLVRWVGVHTKTSKRNIVSFYVPISTLIYTYKFLCNRMYMYINLKQKQIQHDNEISKTKQ